MEFFIDLILLLLSSYVIWKVCDSFQNASMYLGRKMPLGTRGATINAIGSSFPEFMTSFIAIFSYTDNDGAMFGIANTTGSLIYNITIIPFFVILGCVFFKNIKKMEFDKNILIRDSIFVILLQVYLMYILSTGVMTTFSSFILVFIYLIYLFIIFNWSKGKKDSDTNCNPEQCNTKQKHVIKSICDIDLYALCFPKHKKQNTKISFTILVLSIIIFYFSCDILVASSYAIGEFLNIPSYFIAITITAVATSLPDTILSVKDAKIGEFDDSITNVFGSNIFNISFCIGLPVLIFCILNHTDIVLGNLSLSYINCLKFMSIFYVIFVFCLLKLSKKHWIITSISLFAMYLIFLIYTGMEIKETHKNLPVKKTEISKQDNYTMPHHHQKVMNVFS